MTFFFFTKFESLIANDIVFYLTNELLNISNIWKLSKSIEMNGKFNYHFLIYNLRGLHFQIQKYIWNKKIKTIIIILLNEDFIYVIYDIIAQTL